MKKLHILSLLLLLLVQLINAQPNKRTNFWYFNDSIGLNFNSGVPVEDFLGMVHSHQGGASTICDTNGSLMFYSTGKWVWNRNHEIMEDGYGGASFYPGTQGALCMPKPDSDSLYYIFTSRHYESDNPMFYYIVNMASNNGLGQ